LSVLRQRARTRPAAINASTVFAITLAMVAGLIFAYVFKRVLLDRKPDRPPPEPAKLAVAVAASNILDTTQVRANQVRTIRLDPESPEYKKYEREAKDRGTTILSAAGAVGRVVKQGKSIPADQPLYADDFDPLEYPVPVESLLEKGKRAIQISVPARSTLLRVDSRVDVLATMANDTPAFGAAGASASAVVAKDVRVVARFGTTQKGALPQPGPTWPYTLEVAPWQYAVIDLAKNLGATFSLSLAGNPPSTSSDNAVAVSTTPPASAKATSQEQAYKDVEDHYRDTGRITAADVAELFGIGPPTPELVHRVERLYGLRPAPDLEFRFKPPVEPTGDRSGTSPGTTPIKPAADTTGTPGGKVGQGTIPAGWVPSTSVASAATGANMGFHATGSPTAGCPTCGKKK
jgi:Flp pilus assembly protein CpaB